MDKVGIKYNDVTLLVQTVFSPECETDGTFFRVLKSVDPTTINFTSETIEVPKPPDMNRSEVSCLI